MARQAPDTEKRTVPCLRLASGICVMTAKRLPWGHESRYCCRCGKVGPRCIVAGGWSHYYCLSDHEKRERRTPATPSLSQRMREAGFTRRPSAKSLPSDE
jgi:hypothetical protein